MKTKGFICLQLAHCSNEKCSFTVVVSYKKASKIILLVVSHPKQFHLVSISN